MTFFNREREWKFYMEEIFSLNNNLLIDNDVSLNGNLISKNIFVNGNIIIGNNFGINFDDGTTITSGNITSTSGIDERISNYLFNKPDAPTDSSHNFQIITDNTGTHPTITLQWSNPTTKRVAFPFGTSPGYNNPSNNNPLPLDRSNFNSNKNITRLPYSKELKIEFHEENTPHSWSNLTLNSDGIGNTQHIIPNTVITANINSSGISPTLLANTVSNTYTEFKSGKGLQIGKNYQFRIYLTNEITEEDGSYNYLYIPSKTEYIAFGGFANVTSPTEILFPVNDYNILQIKGINGNTYVETGMHTTFQIPENYDLRVRYGFDIDIRANVNSKQMPNKRANTNSGKFITENLRNSNFTEDIDLVSGLQLQNGDYINWYPEFDYNVRNFFMEANLDIVGNIAQTTIGNTITTLKPTRENIGATNFFNSLPQQNYTSFFSSNNFGMTKSNIYRYGNPTSIENIYILDSSQSFALTFNPNITLINNSDDYIGLDSSGVVLCNFTSNIVNYDITERFNDETNYSKGFLQITNINSTANIIVTGAIEDSSIYNITKGYYTDITLTQLGINNINLSRFPDICNNNYQKYKVNVNQNVNFSNGFENKGTIYFDFGVAEKSANQISFSFNLNSFSNLILNNNFYGMPRPNINYSSNKPIISFNYTFSNVNSFWRRNLNIIENINVKLLNNYITFTDTNNSKNWITEIYNSGTLQFNRNIANTTWNIITANSTNNNFSRNNGTNPQFNITFNVNNNIGFSNTLSYNEDFNWDNSSKVLWWDYTWGINNIIPSNVFFEKPSSLTIHLCESINPFTSGNTIPTLFNHDNKITYETAMWSKDGWCGANITLTNDYNPYIDYGQYNLITDISYNYSNFDNSGINQTINYGRNVYTKISSAETVNFNNLKWVIFKLQNSTQNNNNLEFNTNLSWLEDYIVFYLEEDKNGNNGSYSIIIDDNGSTISSSKTYWLDVQNTSVNPGGIRNFTNGQSQNPIGSNNGCNTGDSGEKIKIINRFRAGGLLIYQYIAFGIKPGKKLKTITFSYV